jgi:hypothetical protein
MLSSLSKQSSQPLMMPSSRYPVAGLAQPGWRPSWNLLAHTAERLLSILGWAARRGIWTTDRARDALPRLQMANTRYEIMRIEARRRI